MPNVLTKIPNVITVMVTCYVHVHVCDDDHCYYQASLSLTSISYVYEQLLVSPALVMSRVPVMSRVLLCSLAAVSLTRTVSLSPCFTGTGVRA